jgi:5'(3')-deoxyribonucleotidase
MKAKEQVGADIYIEDSPDNVKNLRSKGLYTICFGNSTNRDVEAPRAGSWEEAYRLIHERLASLKA